MVVMNKVVVKTDNVYGPNYEDRPLIDAHEWKSVSEFVHKKGQREFNRGMLCKYCQNVPLQKLFRDPSVSFSVEIQDVYERERMVSCLDYLKEQFRFYETDELCCLLPRLPRESDELFEKHVAFFRSCQPFLGRDRATVLSMIYLNKISLGSVRDLPIENLLRSFRA
jgi:hypothetical protein